MSEEKNTGTNSTGRPPYKWDDELKSVAREVGKSIEENERREISERWKKFEINLSS